MHGNASRNGDASISATSTGIHIIATSTIGIA
jgi:hypothetical protein